MKWYSFYSLASLDAFFICQIYTLRINLFYKTFASVFTPMSCISFDMKRVLTFIQISVSANYLDRFLFDTFCEGKKILYSHYSHYDHLGFVGYLCSYVNYVDHAFLLHTIYQSKTSQFSLFTLLDGSDQIFDNLCFSYLDD